MGFFSCIRLDPPPKKDFWIRACVNTRYNSIKKNLDSTNIAEFKYNILSDLCVVGTCIRLLVSTDIRNKYEIVYIFNIGKTFYLY